MPIAPAIRSKDKAVDIFYLLGLEKELVSIGKRFPFSGKVMVGENEFLALVDQLRTLPSRTRSSRPAG